MNEFGRYHPVVSFVYFMAVIGFSMFFMNPVCLIISLISGFVYLLMLNTKKTLKFGARYMLPLFVASAVVNPIFNHQGVTMLAYLPDGNPLTLESIMYGIAAACMIISVINWFSCFNQIMTSDKIMYLFGKIIPTLSLVFSMTLRFVPNFAERIKTVAKSQRYIGKDTAKGHIIKRAKMGIKVLSVATTWCLESAIETANSMKSRGYGIGGRTAFSNYRFSKRDIKVLSVTVLLAVYILIGGILGKIEFKYFPSLRSSEASVQGISILLAYLLLCALPIIIECWEVRKWKLLKSKI